MPSSLITNTKCLMESSKHEMPMSKKTAENRMTKPKHNKADKLIWPAPKFRTPMIQFNPQPS